MPPDETGRIGSEREETLDELIPDNEELKRLLVESSNGPEDAAIHGEAHQLLHQAVLHVPTQL